MRPVTVVRKVRCRASRLEVWAHVSNTLRLNRAVGTSRLAVVARDTEGLDRFELRGRLGGIAVAYTERPFSWSTGEYFAFERSFLRGPVTSLTTQYDLADAPGDAGCDVSVRVSLVPRSALLRPIVWLATRRTVAAITAFLASVDAPATPVLSSPANAAALRGARDRLARAPVPGALVERLVERVERSDDLDLVPIRPFALARAWSVDPIELLRVCLSAVPAGLLELRWGLVCPNCRTTSQVLPSLRELAGSGHCHACDLRFDTDLDRAVEAQFFPHPAVRVVPEQPFCIGGPALTPHVVAQQGVESGDDGTLNVPSEVGRLRLFARGGATATIDVVSGAPTEVDATLEPSSIRPAQVSVAPRGSLRLSNRSGQGRHVQLQRPGWLTDAATAHHVATLPEFRRSFGIDALRPGLALRVGNVAILFSDVCGSTALYAKVGDAPAFGLVSACIDYQAVIIERRGGAVVKTIGDAVMAAFTEGRQAAEAGAEILARWPDFVREHPLASTVDLKVGAYAGPCQIVRANEVLDYFGQTVNAAARIQHLAGARELVLGAVLATGIDAACGVVAVEAFEAKVKGIDEALPVVRFRPPPPVAA